MNGELNASDELAQLDFDDLTSSQAVETILAILNHHPNWDESRDFYLRATRWLVGVWEHDRHNFTNHRERNHWLERDVLHFAARFILKLSGSEALQISTPLIDAVDNHPKEVGDFLAELIIFANHNPVDCFWEIWQALADKAVSASWTEGLGNERPFEQSFINNIFLGMDWKDDARHWRRLDGHAHRLDEVAQQLPATAPCMLAYSGFLCGIGQQSLPESFKVVGSLLKKSSAIQITSNSSISFNLETSLRRFVYSQPHRLKSDPVLRDSILNILDALIAGGSSSAYQMRDDFVTPIE
ncbi:MAG: hypothetical protein OXI37_02040 [Gammaproteobacteria bacterium]|nr:hypothetical protein [Gammaproteobacteria bacterium]